jgi:serine/threonine-protein kinase
LASLIFALRPSAAFGQEAEANVLFDQGRALMGEKRFAEAAQKFEFSQALDPAVGTLLNLAECYVALGRTASAWAAFRDAAGLSAANKQGERQRYAAKRAKELEPDLSMLVLVVPDEARVEGLMLTRNALSIPETLWGSPIPVDPGEVRIDAVAPGREAWMVERQVGPKRDRVEVVLPVLGTRAAEPAPAPVEATPPPSPPPTAAPAPADAAPPRPPAEPAKTESSSQRTIAYVVGGAGIVLVGVGAFLFVDSRNKFDDANCPDNRCVYGVGDKSLHDEGRTLETASYVTGGVGIAALATATYLFLSSGSEAPSTRVGVASTPGGARFDLQGSF